MKLRNTSPLKPLTPAVSTTTEFATAQQEQIAALCARLAGIERRFNAQQQRIGSLQKFNIIMKAENVDLRKRLRFLENAAKLTAGPR
jgi:hypothetical protein